PRYRMLAVRYNLEGGLDPANQRALEPVLVLVEEAEPEHAKGIGIRSKLLHDKVVVLAGLHIAAVLADRVAGLALEAEFLRALHLLASLFHDELDKGVARARGGRRPQHLDPLVGERFVDIAPGPVGVR